MVTTSPVKAAYKEVSTFCKRVQDKIKLPKMVGKVTKASTSFVGHFYDIPQNLSRAVATINILSTLSIPGNACKAIDNFSEAVAKGKSRGRRVYFFVKGTVSTNKAINGVASTLKLLYKFKAIGKNAIKWIPPFEFINLGFEVVDLGFTAEMLHGTGKVYQAVSKAKKGPLNTQTLSTLTDKISGKQKSLMISTEVNINGEKGNLVERIKKVAETLKTTEASETDKEQATSSGKKILEGLKKRARLHFGLTCASFVNTILTIAAIAALLIMPLLPFTVPLIVPIALGTLLGTATVALVIAIVRDFLIKRDPFDENAKRPIQELPAKAKKKCEEIVKNLRSIPTRALSLFSRPAPTVA